MCAIVVNIALINTDHFNQSINQSIFKVA